MFTPAKKGQNPREHKNHRERGRKKYSYTVEDVGALVGLSPETVKTYAQRGVLDLESLESIYLFKQRRDQRGGLDSCQQLALQSEDVATKSPEGEES